MITTLTTIRCDRDCPAIRSEQGSVVLVWMLAEQAGWRRDRSDEGDEIHLCPMHSGAVPRG